MRQDSLELYSRIGQTLNERFGADKYTFVDLDLPSGNLWMDRNLGYTEVNVWGNNYKWGNVSEETKQKVVKPSPKGGGRVWKDYFDTTDGGETFIKYSSNGGFSELGLTDDAAYQAIGDYEGHIVKMPSKEDFLELFTLENKFVENYKGGAISGRLFKSTNGNELFFPYKPGGIGYWSCSLSENGDDMAYYMAFGESYIDIYEYFRYGCYSIRPILIQ